MKMFDRDGKINFVDENNVYLGYDTREQCCEDFGWFVSDDKVTTCAGIEEGVQEDLDGWCFDREFFEHVTLDVDTDDDKYGEMVIFRIVNGDAQKFIHLYNSHNG